LLGDGADVPVIFKVAANDSALGIALGLTPLDKACSYPLSNCLFFHYSFSRYPMTSIVLITGASGGIGRALANQLHSQGLRVAVVGRDMDRLTDVDAALRIAADTTTPEGAQQAIATCQESLGAAPSLLAHCVGSTLIAPLHRTSVQAYREVMRINLDSAVFMFQAWVTALQGGPGAAVMASSVVARIGVANHEAIAAAKGGVEALVRSAAATYAAQGLRINAVAPGLTETPMTANMLKMAAMREGAARQYPLGGIQSAEQVADVMAFLLGDGAARLTGQVIAVDGGFTTVRPLVR
jgi:NAD(P)-dependent dehydrogenase (short-subunit alcohol dehydrogenase family)